MCVPVTCVLLDTFLLPSLQIRVEVLILDFTNLF